MVQKGGPYMYQVNLHIGTKGLCLYAGVYRRTKGCVLLTCRLIGAQKGAPIIQVYRRTLLYHIKGAPICAPFCALLTYK